VSGRIFKSTLVTGTATLVSRITGLVREIAYAVMFGASGFMDAWLVAFKIPNFLRRLFAEGSFSQAFVPVISEYKHKRSQEEVRQLVDEVAGTFGVVLFVVTAIGVIAAPLIILAFAPAWHDDMDQWSAASSMLRWTFPYLFFISLSALFSGVLNSYNKFALPAYTQVIMNIVMIVVTLWIAPRSSNPGIALAMGVFVSGLLQLAFQLPSVIKLGLFRWPRWKPAAEGVRRIGKLMLPGIFGSSVAQVSLLIDTQIASLILGGVSWLYFADRLMEFPLGVFSIALATVILPSLSRHHASESKEHFTGTLDWALRLVIVLVSPAAVAMLVFAGPLTATTFGYGKFDTKDVYMASYALMAYSWGLLGFSLVKVLAPGYFARQDTRTPVRVGLIALGINMALNLGVALPAIHFGWFPYPHVLIATSTCVSAAINTTLLWTGLKRIGVYSARPGWGALLGRVLFANAAMAAVLIWLGGDLQGWLAAPASARVARLALCIVAGAAAYFGALLLAGTRLRHLRNVAGA
jgi:putative peptidoglycan lipid II flippase